MLRINNILFPTDFSNCASQALEHALFLSKCFRATLHIIHAIVLHQEDPNNPAFHFPDQKDLHEKLGRIAREKMGNELRASVENDKEIDIAMEELRGYSVSNVLLEYAEARDIDLIVMGTHGRRGLNYMLLGSVAQEVVREAPCPVYTIRETNPPGAPRKIDTILTPIDFSNHSRLAVSMARETAGLYNASLQLLHVVEQVSYPTFYTPEMGLERTLNANIAHLARTEMERFFDKAQGPDVQADFRVAQGHVIEEILDYVNKNSVDMVVIATHGLSGLKHLLLGSVAEKVIRRAPCPVLTVKAFGKNSLGN